MEENKGLISVPSGQIKAVRDLDQIIKEVMLISKDAGTFERGYMESKAYELIELAITKDFMAPVLKLAGKKVGFLTDKPSYTDEVIRACVIEALVNGLSVTGNQFNILAGKMYTTKEGFTALLRRIKGLSYDWTPSYPKSENGETTVLVKIDWSLDGVKGTKTINFPVNKNEGMKADGLVGKAERKAKKWLYYEITGKDLGEGDVVETTYTEDKKEAPVDVVEDLTEQDLSGVSPEVQKQSDTLFESSKTLESLEKRMSNILAKYPNVGTKVYEEMKAKFA